MTRDETDAAPRRAPARSVLSRLRRRPWLVLSSTVLLAVVLTLWLEEDLRPYPKQPLRAVTAGRVYQSGVLSDGDLRDAVRKHHLHTVIDLRKPPDDDERAIEHEGEVLAELGVEHVRLPADQVPEDATVDRFLELMSDSSRYPVLIHCHHGFGRSVLFSALYRIEFEGWGNEDARRATRHFLRLPWSSFDDEAPKGSYLENYVPRHDPPRPRSADASGNHPSTVY